MVEVIIVKLFRFGGTYCRKIKYGGIDYGFIDMEKPQEKHRLDKCTEVQIPYQHRFHQIIQQYYNNISVKSSSYSMAHRYELCPCSREKFPMNILNFMLLCPKLFVKRLVER